jgi:hypothetical protein
MAQSVIMISAQVEEVLDPEPDGDPGIAEVGTEEKNQPVQKQKPAGKAGQGKTARGKKQKRQPQKNRKGLKVPDGPIKR